MLRIRSASLMITLGLAGLAGMCISLFADAGLNTAQAKQCIYNKAGFVLSVNWYQPSDIALFINDRGQVQYAVRRSARPAQTDTYPVFQGRCNESSTRYVAVLSMEGYKSDRIQTSGYRTLKQDGHVQGIVNPREHVASQVSVNGDMFVPMEERDGVFAVVVPSSNHWLDVWGTVFGPEFGEGGRL